MDKESLLKQLHALTRAREELMSDERYLPILSFIALNFLEMVLLECREQEIPESDIERVQKRASFEGQLKGRMKMRTREFKKLAALDFAMMKFFGEYLGIDLYKYYSIDEDSFDEEGLGDPDDDN